MFKKLFDYFFWLVQPASILSHADNVFGLGSLGVLLVAVVFRLLAGFSKNKIDRKLFLKIWRLAATTGILGLIWFGLRFENTPIFAERIWFGLIVLLGVIWLVLVLKYLIFGYRTERDEFAHELLKSKYLPKSK